MQIHERVRPAFQGFAIHASFEWAFERLARFASRTYAVMQAVERELDKTKRYRRADSESR